MSVSADGINLNFCACMGPQFGQPYCPCEMQMRGLSNGEEYRWSKDDEERLKESLAKLKIRGER